MAQENEDFEQKVGACEGCGKITNIDHIPDPFASEIRDDYTLVWLCKDCQHESMMDI